MSYCRIDIGGKERGLKFNQMAMIILSEKTDKDHPLATAGYALIYAGLKANCYVKSDEPDFTFEQVCEWVDVISNDDMNKVNEAFMLTEAYKRGVTYQSEQEFAKKKGLKASAKKSTKNKPQSWLLESQAGQNMNIIQVAPKRSISQAGAILVNYRMKVQL